jgi:paraquat-inducible protein B
MLVKRGLRAQLQTGSLLTGQLYVDLDMHPKAPLRLANVGRAEPELPTIQGNIEQMTVALKGILEKLDKVDFASIGAELEGTLKGTNAFANAPQLQSSLADLSASLASMRGILRKVDSRAEPLTANLEQALAAARDALEKSKSTMTLVDGILTPESPMYEHALRLAQELAATARSIRSLVDMLERNPQSLLFGKKPPGEQ